MFNLDFPDSNHLAKTLTIVSGPDTVNLTYHNFFASKEKVTQVIAEHCVLLSSPPPATDPPHLHPYPAPDYPNTARGYYTMGLRLSVSVLLVLIRLLRLQYPVLIHTNEITVVL